MAETDYTEEPQTPMRRIGAESWLGRPAEPILAFPRMTFTVVQADSDAPRKVVDYSIDSAGNSRALRDRVTGEFNADCLNIHGTGPGLVYVDVIDFQTTAKRVNMHGVRVVNFDPVRIFGEANTAYECPPGGASFRDLTEIELPSVDNVPHKFLAGTTKLRTLDLSAIAGAISVGDMCLFGSGIVELQCRSPISAISIGSHFLHLRNLREISLTFTRVTNIPDFFMNSCEQIRSATLEFRAATRIGNLFMAGCRALIELRLKIPRVESIGHGFMLGCSALCTADFVTRQGGARINERDSFMADVGTMLRWAVLSQLDTWHFGQEE